MARTRLEKTLADYVVIAISPALIMTLVGSLVFFLLTVIYRGQFESRMHWILFWFVFGAVLVARIAIQEGRDRARLYGVVLCGAVAFGVMRFVDDAVLIAWCLLAVVWWCSSKLTWDCTLIDDSEDASGSGLLQSAGLDQAVPPASPAPDEVPAPTGTASQTDKRSRLARIAAAKQSRITEKQKIEAPADDESPSDELENGKTRPHAPGLWVVYFSLAALPLFGVGQLFIPAQEADRRSYAFQLLTAYVASAIALLLTTSFLGLRRYLRQRKLEMPVAMTGAWLGVGTVLLAAILLLALLIPRPQGEYSVTGLIEKLDAKVRNASKFAVLKNDKAAGEGRRLGDQDPQAKQPGEGQPPGKREPGGKQEPPRNQEPGDQQDGNKQEGNKREGNKQPGGQADGKAAQGDASEKNGKGSEKSGSQSGGDQDGKSSDQSKQQADANSDKPDQQQNANAQQRPDQQQAGNPPEQGQKNQQKNQGQQAQQRAVNKPAPANSMKSAATNLVAMLAPLVKWIAYGLLVLAGIYLLMRYWTQLVEFLAKLWAELLSLLGLRRSPASESDADAAASIVPEIRPFASYVNPFANGTADRMSPQQLVRYTFEALEAWARETVVNRPPDQTPQEFADELGRQRPLIAQEVAQTTRLYMHIAYSQKPMTRDRLDVLEKMWRRFEI